METSPVADERGMALLFALVLVVSLAAGVILFQRQALLDYQAVRAGAEAVQLRLLARSGIELGLALLVDDLRRGAVDHLGEDWNRAAEAGELLSDGEHRCELTIVDQSGRIQVNALLPAAGRKRNRRYQLAVGSGLTGHATGTPRELDGTVTNTIPSKNETTGPGYDTRQARLLFRLLTGSRFRIDHTRARRMVAALIDWLDADRKVCEFEGQAGAEIAYYQALDPPRRPADRPIAALGELALVRGFDQELLAGSGDRPGLAAFLSAADIDGPARGRININTAPAAVLEALSPRIDPDFARELVRYRRANPNRLADRRWPERLRPNLGLDMRLITTASTVFEIRATARRHRQWRRITCLVERPAFTITGWFEE